MSKRKQPRFHCTSERQKKVIAAKCAQRRAEQQQPKQPKATPSVSDRVKKTIAARPAFRLPLQNERHCWNIYRVPNKILNGKQDGDVHGGLVLGEENDNVILVEVTHSPKNGKRNNIPIRNIVSTDKEKDTETGQETGGLRKSYIKRKLVVSIKTQNGVEGIDIVHLNKQLNDLHFSAEEQETILTELSHLDSAEGQYILFKDLAKKKTDN